MSRAARSAAPLTSLWLAAVLAAVSGAVSACSVDDRMIEVAPQVNGIVLGTFEGGARAPDPRFEAWVPAWFNTNIGSASFGLVQPGFDSDWSLGLEWQLTDPPNGALDYPGALLMVGAIEPLDVTGFAGISFAQVHEHQGDCKPILGVRVFIPCDGLGAAMMSPILPVTPTWTVASAPLASFGPAFYPPPNGTGRDDCLRQATGVQIGLESNLADGECTSGLLRIDDVVIQ